MGRLCQALLHAALHCYQHALCYRCLAARHVLTVRGLLCCPGSAKAADGSVLAAKDSQAATAAAGRVRLAGLSSPAADCFNVDLTLEGSQAAGN